MLLTGDTLALVEALGRLCIFDPAYGVASVRVGDHATFGWMAVIEFAGGYTSDEAKVARREEAGAPKPEPG